MSWAWINKLSINNYLVDMEVEVEFKQYFRIKLQMGELSLYKRRFRNEDTTPPEYMTYSKKVEIVLLLYKDKCKHILELNKLE